MAFKSDKQRKFVMAKLRGGARSNVKPVFIKKEITKKLPMIKGWKDTSKIFSDGSKSIEWRSKFKVVSVFDNRQFGSGWVFAVTSLRKDEPPQLLSDTNNTKQQALRKAIKFMENNKNGILKR